MSPVTWPNLVPGPMWQCHPWALQTPGHLPKVIAGEFRAQAGCFCTPISNPFFPFSTISMQHSSGLPFCFSAVSPGSGGHSSSPPSARTKLGKPWGWRGGRRHMAQHRHEILPDVRGPSARKSPWLGLAPRKPHVLSATVSTPREGAKGERLPREGKGTGRGAANRSAPGATTGPNTPDLLQVTSPKGQLVWHREAWSRCTWRL